MTAAGYFAVFVVVSTVLLLLEELASLVLRHLDIKERRKGKKRKPEGFF